MKVLIISDAWYPQVNGVVRTYEHLRDELEAMNHSTKIIGPADFAISMPIPFYPEIRLVVAPYKRLKHMVKDYAPDKIHIATEGPLGWAGRKYCIKNNLPFSTSYHTQFPDYVAKRFVWLIPSLYNVVHRLAIKVVKRFHSASSILYIATQSLESQLKDWGFETPMVRLTRGVDFSVFYIGEKTRLKDCKTPIALYVGRIAIEKNLEDFLDMPWNGSKVLVGDGPAREGLENRYPDALFVGEKTGNELADYYRSSDVFVFPSKTDTFGIVLIEALACGLPVAAYNVIGPKDIITSSDLGVLDDKDLAKAAQSAIKIKNREKCAQHVGNNYSWNEAGKQFLDAL
ncbi:MAG: glycosyltransferase family 1 protein [Alphaproteobacteria bacterium]|nr:glycosyltransferase family 1 protein [Alphaproteobacteria bacterium]